VSNLASQTKKAHRWAIFIPVQSIEIRILSANGAAVKLTEELTKLFICCRRRYYD